MIEYRVVAVPERLPRATALAAQAGATLILDEQHEGTFRTHQRALASAPNADHVVVLEDDAILCPHFTEHVARLIGQRPDVLIGLYVGRSHPVRVQPLIAELVSTRPAWLDDDRLTARLRWGVGYVMPVADVPAVLTELAGGDQHPWSDADGRIGGWHSRRRKVAYPFPSPVDHDDSIPSTTSSGKSSRTAWEHCRGGDCA